MKIQNAFRIGLLGTLGVGVGLLILTSIANLSTIITYIGAALFLALGLDPAISWLERRGLPRWAAILIVMTGSACSSPPSSSPSCRSSSSR